MILKLFPLCRKHLVIDKVKITEARCQCKSLPDSGFVVTMRFIRTHVKNTWYNYNASKAKQNITKTKINKRPISNNSF